MANTNIPNEPPPTYTQATGSSSTTSAPSSGNHPTGSSNNSRLDVPGASSSSSSSIPDAYRRSMELESRPLPKGWVRTLDPESGHQFYVDTRVDPPRSCWDHPYDDEQYLSSLPTEERERIEHENMTSYLGNAKHDPSIEDIIHGHSDVEDEADHHNSKHHHSSGAAAASSSIPAELPPRPSDGKGKGKDNRSFGRKFKDKVTGTTHEEREAARRKREEEERRLYQQHLKVREAMQKAMQTGESQYLGKDRNGEDVWLQPPPRGSMGYGGGYGGMQPGYGGRMYDPYMAGPYCGPGTYARPMGPYARRGYGGGYGYGAGMPMMAMGGGLLAGGLLGGLMF